MNCRRSEWFRIAGHVAGLRRDIRLAHFQAALEHFACQPRVLNAGTAADARSGRLIDTRGLTLERCMTRLFILRLQTPTEYLPGRTARRSLDSSVRDGLKVEIHSHPDLKAAIALLEAAALPASDLNQDHLQHFFFVGPESDPDGLVGLELCGAEALLRSLVVAPGRRSVGIGRALLAHAESYAGGHGIRSIFLLTTTADQFFARYGYVPASRAAVPESIRRTREFADLCPASSAFMVKRLVIGGT